MYSPKNILFPCASLILTDCLAAGEGLIAYNLLNFLGKSGHNLTVLAPQVKLQTAIYNAEILALGDYEFFPAPEEFQYLLRWRKYCKKVEKLFNNEFKNYEFDIIHYMMPVNINQSYSPILKKPLIVGPVFHPWTDLKPEEYSFNEIILKKDFPIVGRIKNHIKRYLKKINKEKFEKTLEFADKIVVTLDCARKFLPDKYQNKIVKIPIGVDTYYFKPSAKLPDNNTILFLAYIVRRKGLEYLIQAINIIRRQIPDIKLLIVGDGPDKDFFIKQTDDLKLNDCIEFLPAAIHKDTINYFQKAQIYVLPSLCEPFGMSILEAMACGLPVISTNAGGPPEILGERNKNLLVPPRNAEALAEKIMQLLFNYEKCKHIGFENREYVVRNFDWRIIAAKYNKLYDELCE